MSPQPYKLASDDLLFAVHAVKTHLSDTAETRAEFFAKPKVCLRASPLPKQFGSGIHHVRLDAWHSRRPGLTNMVACCATIGKVHPSDAQQARRITE